MKKGKPERYESKDKNGCYDDFEDEEEEDEFDDEFDDEEKVIENFDPNTITVKLQKPEVGLNQPKFMKIDKEIEFRWLMIRYCEHMGMEYLDTVFKFNGACVQATDTPLKLSMVDGDIISVHLRSKTQGAYRPVPNLYYTLCIREHKRRDKYISVARNEPLLRSIKRNFSDSGNVKHDSTCFFYKGEKLKDLDTAAKMLIEDGDIIDAFNFDDNRSSLSFVSGLPSTLHQPPTFKGNSDINMAGRGKTSLSRIHNRNVTSSARAWKGVQIQSEVAPLDGDGMTESCTAVDVLRVSVADTFQRGSEEGGNRGSDDGSASRFKARRTERGRWQRLSDESSSSVMAPKKKKSSKDCDWLISERVDGGPLSPNVIPSFGGHIAHTLWATPNDYGRPVLTCYHRYDKARVLSKYRLPSDVQDISDTSGLSHLPHCMFEHLNMPLISAFVERWQPDTNSFHLPFGEMTILLHDVAQILGIRVDGDICKVETDEGALVDPLIFVCEFFGRSVEQLRLPLDPSKNASIYKSGGILVEAVCEMARIGDDDMHVKGFLAALLGSTLFVDKSGDRLRPQLFPLLADTHSISTYAWGAGTLAYLYRQLGIASRAKVNTISGCLSLLQAWIYDYFPIFRPGPAMDIPPTQPRVCCWRSTGAYNQSADKLLEYRRVLDGLTHCSIKWEPYGPGQEKLYPRTLYSGCIRFMDVVEPYQPDRCLRQLGYVQMIPNPIMKGRVHRPSSGIGYDVDFGPLSDHLWDCWVDHCVRLSNRSRPVTIFPGETEADYEGWYVRVSHPLVIDPDHRDAPLPREEADVTAETALALLDQFTVARDIVDDRDQLRYFRHMLMSVEPLVDARLRSRHPPRRDTLGDRVVARKDAPSTDDDES